MSQTPNADSDGGGAFTCGALLMCLYLPGLSKKKAEEAGASRKPTSEQGQPAGAEQEATGAPGRAASMEKLECSSLCSGSNIVFDFVVEAGERDQEVQGYCPSPCFDLPAELIWAGERCGAGGDTPVMAAFAFDGYQRCAALKKTASCRVAGVAGSEMRPPHLVRVLSASGSRVPAVPAWPPAMSSCDQPNGTAVVDDSAIQRRDADGR